MSPLHILSVAYPLAPVSADPAGGAEQVLAALDGALVAAGHRSTVVAMAGSTVAGTLHPLPAPAGPLTHQVQAAQQAAARATVAALVAADPPDLVHLHGIDFDQTMPPPGPPALATLHLPLAWYPAAALAPDRPRTFLQPVSADQAARAPADLDLLPAIPNGVDLQRYRPMPKRDHFLVLGRVAPEKGFHHALAAAVAADVPLLAAGALFPYPAHQRYWADEVEPRLDPRRRWLGPVAGTTKRAVLAQARALLVPSLAPETSSLVAMEALASGTPVIAFAAGALPGIVEHGVTGFIVADEAGMADAIRRVDEIDPARCRAAACARFPLAATIEAYLALYRRLAA